MQYTMFDVPSDAIALRRGSRRKTAHGIARIQEALAPYIDHKRLNQLVQQGAFAEGDLRMALLTSEAPPEVQAMLSFLAAYLRPSDRLQVKSPADIAAVLMLEMGWLDQEELRTVLLDTKNRVQAIHTVYKGSVNSAIIRIGEVFKPAIRANSAALIVAHNHPSSDPTPSPEDILVTRQIVEAGKLLDIDCLDHLVISHNKWVSMRERGLGFPT
jgi:DNA repair protein RadC